VPDTKVCVFPGCGKLVVAKSHCAKHWHQFAKENPDKINRWTPAIDRWKQRYVVEPNGCWRWTACLGSAGYGQISDRGKTHHAHRFGYIHFKGDPGEKHLDHLCRNRWCVNPDHLEPVTLMENLLRGDRTHLKKKKFKTHCKRGHPLEEGNLYYTAEGKRFCKTCAKTDASAAHYRKKAKRLMSRDTSDKS
jgi:hypothetical protein